ncbi:MAG: chromosomal replication initiator protein DnaA [Solirubrobacterales bacterium]|nr:chromosomal replication initiator protein DnaA [Solirubrobacterales bacterium]
MLSGDAYVRSVAVAAPACSDELTDLWRRVTGELERSVPRSTFELWLRPLVPVTTRGATLYLSAPEPVRAWVERRYCALIASSLHRHCDALSDVAFVTADAAERAEPTAPESLPLNPLHTFDRFVIGDGNRLAHAASLAVAELPGEAYNPLFLHGPPGLGKTHLLGAILAYLRRNHPSLTTHHTTAERFTSEFVSALRRDGPEAFKARYRELDALLIDDVQVLEGKQHTEEEFVHTFNALFAAGKQIVLSSDRPPEALSRLADRLRDRFRWGLQVELEPPDLRTRMALVWRFAADATSDVPEPQVLREIATLVPGNVRILEGAMTRVMAVASLLSEPMSTPLVHRALGAGQAAGPPPSSEPPTLEAIQDAVCRLQGLTRQELLSARRSARIAQSRQLAMYLARELTPLSLAEIARAFDRDHTTVLHAVRAVTARLEPGTELAGAVHSLRGELGRPPAGAPLSTASRLPPPAAEA